MLTDGSENVNVNECLDVRMKTREGMFERDNNLFSASEYRKSKSETGHFIILLEERKREDYT